MRTNFIRRLVDAKQLYRAYRQCHGRLAAARYAWMVSREVS